MAVSRTKQFSGSGNVMGGSLVVSSHSPLQQRLTAGTFQPQGVGCRVFGFPQSCHTALSQQVPLGSQAQARVGWTSVERQQHLEERQAFLVQNSAFLLTFHPGVAALRADYEPLLFGPDAKVISAS